MSEQNLYKGHCCYVATSEFWYQHNYVGFISPASIRKSSMYGSSTLAINYTSVGQCHVFSWSIDFLSVKLQPIFILHNVYELVGHILELSLSKLEYPCIYFLQSCKLTILNQIHFLYKNWETIEKKTVSIKLKTVLWGAW